MRKMQLSETLMANSDLPKIRFDVSFVRGLWVATVYNGDNTENRSFRNEDDDFDHAEARIDQIRSGHQEIRIS
ncbi:hypothetical protein ASC96_25675 [Rhizobium sp. Root1204]|nr:hypothetical protein ASC96_25675 [Rhizobium sp. Root1204]